MTGYRNKPTSRKEAAERAIESLQNDMENFYKHVIIRAGLTNISYGRVGGYGSIDEEPIDKNKDCDEFLKKTGLASSVFQRKRLKSMAYRLRLVGDVINGMGEEDYDDSMRTRYQDMLQQLEDSGLIGVLSRMETGRIFRKICSHSDKKDSVSDILNDEYALLKQIYQWGDIGIYGSTASDVISSMGVMDETPIDETHIDESPVNEIPDNEPKEDCSGKNDDNPFVKMEQNKQKKVRRGWFSYIWK